MKEKKIIVSRPFSWSPNGLEVLRFRAGVQMVPAKAAEIACSRGWAKEFEAAQIGAPTVSAEVIEAPKRRGRKPKLMG
jgi:hypothetical protein